MKTTQIEVMTFPDGRVDTKNAALYLGLSKKTLDIHRSKGTGPRYIKPGRIFYYIQDLDAWLNDQGRVTSTAQARVIGHHNRQA